MAGSEPTLEEEKEVPVEQFDPIHLDSAVVFINGLDEPRVPGAMFMPEGNQQRINKLAVDTEPDREAAGQIHRLLASLPVAHPGDTLFSIDISFTGLQPCVGRFR